MATPFDGETFTFTQPDGAELTVRGWGNQYSAVFETLDGYTVIKDPITGYFQYAQSSADGNELNVSPNIASAVPPADLQPGERTRHPAASRQRSGFAATSQPSRWQERRRRKAHDMRAARSGPLIAAPPEQATVGTFVGLCMLVEFPDVAHDIERAEVERFCNQVGYNGFGNQGSVHDYFQDVSNGKVNYTNIVTDWYQAANPRSYYTDESVADGVRARELIREALDNLEATGFDFHQLTADADGFVYATNVYYAGTRVNNWSKGLWPHQWHLGTPYSAAPGRRMMDYQVTDMTPQLTLATFCHENGHMICDFPDLYDYDGDSSGIGQYCLMCAGTRDRTNPADVGAYLKYKAGWLNQVIPYAQGSEVTLSAATDEVILHAKNADEYYLIENRRREGRDASLPSAGLAIWHVDETGDNRFQQGTPAQHYECAIEQADGRMDLEANGNNGDAGDLFSALTADSFGDATQPNSRWWNGTGSGLEITEIGNPAESMTLFMGDRGTDTPTEPIVVNNANPVDIPDASVTGADSTVVIAESHVIAGVVVDVDIEHGYRGDLRVALIAPNGKTVILHDRSGGGANDLVTQFDLANSPGLAVLAGDNSQGVWTLRVQDLAARDVGRMLQWTLRIQPLLTNTIHLVEAPGEPIPDLGTVRRSLHAAASGTVSSVVVSIDITHSYIGDLSVRLLAPNGDSVLLQDRQGGATDNLNTDFTLTDLVGIGIEGIWELEIIDHAQRDVGKLNRWELNIIPS